ncbi:ubiquitin-conjugating enzyme E2 R2-like [Convolutriloba macropyga]|uniref:ubiquitin-conjugating enzyme E2 R2-like n=1 Tax=Convolutriloba macropyga TaxID=536237 RepID=UPI003F51F8BF
MAKAIGAAAKRLTQEIADLRKQKTAGFIVDVDESNIFKWNVRIFGPPDTLYEGGYFKGVMEFPADYPFSPPKFKFITKMWHPNIYHDSGEVCISILHSPVPDQQSGEKAEERWRPTQEARTIILSVISLFSCPNTFSPANVDASVMYRKWCNKEDDRYVKIIRKQVESTKRDAELDGIKIPSSVEEYLKEERSTMVKEEEMDFDFDVNDDYDDDDDNYSVYSGSGAYSDQSDNVSSGLAAAGEGDNSIDDVMAPDSGNEEEGSITGTPTTKTEATFPSSLTQQSSNSSAFATTSTSGQPVPGSSRSTTYF